MTNEVVFEATKVVHPETRQPKMHFDVPHSLMEKQLVLLEEDRCLSNI